MSQAHLVESLSIPQLLLKYRGWGAVEAAETQVLGIDGEGIWRGVTSVISLKYEFTSLKVGETPLAAALLLLLSPITAPSPRVPSALAREGRGPLRGHLVAPEMRRVCGRLSSPGPFQDRKL